MAYINSLDTKEKFEIPVGETTIGRGPFLKVTEKKVSRNHVLIRNNDGDISLKPIHKNPTFVYDVNGNVWTPLEKDKWHQLARGEKFSLLPDSLRFVVDSATVGSSKEKQCEDPSKPTMNVDAICYEKDSKEINEEHPSENSRQEKEVISSDVISKTKNSSWSSGNHTTVSKVKKKRLLPSWMSQSTPKKNCRKRKTASNFIAEDANEEESGNDNKTFKSGSKKKRSRPDNSTAKEKDSDQANTENVSTVLEEVHQQEDQRETARSTKSQDHGEKDDLLDELIGVGTTFWNTNKKSKTPTSNTDTDSTPPLANNTDTTTTTITEETNIPTGKQKQFEASDDAPSHPNDAPEQSILSQLIDTGQPQKPTTKAKEPVENSEDDSIKVEAAVSSANRTTKSDNEKSLIESTTSTTSSTNNKLPLCPYGSKCYRKNPLHFKEYSHNRSEDEDEEDDSNSDKPECQYGTSCYRKNPQHRRDFKHTKAVYAASPVAKMKRPTRNKKKATGKSVLDDASDDDGEENTYDYDDSFLDDNGESDEESYDDSDTDYKPDDDDEEEEDVSELVNEAKDFIKNKKM